MAKQSTTPHFESKGTLHRIFNLQTVEEIREACTDESNQIHSNTTFKAEYTVKRKS